MVYVLEGTSVSLASNVAEVLRHALDLPQKAFSYLSSHGALDIEHMGDFERLVNRLDSEADRDAVVLGAQRFFPSYNFV